MQTKQTNKQNTLETVICFLQSLLVGVALGVE